MDRPGIGESYFWRWSGNIKHWTARLFFLYITDIPLASTTSLLLSPFLCLTFSSRSHSGMIRPSWMEMYHQFQTLQIGTLFLFQQGRVLLSHRILWKQNIFPRHVNRLRLKLRHTERSIMVSSHLGRLEHRLVMSIRHRHNLQGQCAHIELRRHFFVLGKKRRRTNIFNQCRFQWTLLKSKERMYLVLPSYRIHIKL